MTIALCLTACSLQPVQNSTATEGGAGDNSAAAQRAAPVTANVQKAARPANAVPSPVPAATQPQPGPHTEPVAAAPVTNVWVRIRKHLSLARHTDKTIVQDKMAWYERNQDYLDRVSQRATPYLYYVVSQLQKRHMPLDLALLPIIESAYHPFAYSPSRAAGIWQFIPSTGRLFGLKQNWWYDGRRDVVASTNAAPDYLQQLYGEFNNNWLLALAAYNSGKLNVSRAIAENRRHGRPTDFWSLHLPRETRGYVPSLLAVAALLAHPKKYGVHWTPISNQPYFAKVKIDGQIDLATVAKLAGMNIDDVYMLNAGFNRWATDPDGPFYLLLPVNKVQTFEQKLAEYPESERVSWRRHVIRRGETLGGIAHRYHTSIVALRRSNGLHGNFIRTGHSLLIPTSEKPLKYYTLSAFNRRYHGLKKAGRGEQYLYTVHRGDTLWDISHQYGVSIKSLCAWNGLRARSFLHPGQKLKLWIASSQHAIGTASGGNETVAVSLKNGSSHSQTVNYTVKKGDSLWLISRHFGVSVSQLQNWNSLADDITLQPGQKLVVSEPDSGTTGA